jgi:zinc D-Ala-D-Ala carboxypeptidase
MGDLTANFSRREFACRCGACDGGQMDAGFIARLQELRTFYGKPMIITSGYRCLAHNQKTGGAKDSWHMKGRAADIQCGWGGERYRLLELAMMLKFGGIGIAKTFVHLDDRPRDEAMTWGYW